MDKMLEKQIQMVDLRKQYERLRSEIDPAMQTVINACAFINGPQVKGFCNHLSDYLGVPYVIPCGNGTDALQISLMALDLHSGDEVIVPASVSYTHLLREFSYYPILWQVYFRDVIFHILT